MMETFTQNQQEMLDRIESIRPKYLTKPWLHGFEPEPEYYHRLTLEWNDAKRYAVQGYMAAKKILGVDLFFTQSLVVGAILSGEKRIISIILGTAYGKSYGVSCSNLIQAYKGSQITLMAPTRELNKVIRTEMTGIIQNSPKSFSRLLFDSDDKIDKMSQSTSKERYGFSNGGFVDNTIAANATGVHTSVVLDEYSLLDDATAKLAQARAFIGTDKQGKPFTITKITNPHFVNHSYRDMTKEDVAEDELIIWADWRINVSEGKYIGTYINSNKKYEHLRDLYNLTPEQRNELLDLLILEIKRSPIFSDDNNLRSLYLSEFALSNEKGFFNASPMFDDSPYSHDSEFYIGIDVATKGADRIQLTVLERTRDGRLKFVETADIKPKVWVDLVSQREVTEKAIEYIDKYNAKHVAIDVTGVGEFLYAMLGNDYRVKCTIFPIQFAQGATPWRVKKGERLYDANVAKNPHLAAFMAERKRAEIHLDLKYMMDAQEIYFSTQVEEMVHDEMVSIMNIPDTTSGKVQIEKKTEIKKRIGKSPDVLDSVLLALHAYILAMGNTSAIDRLNFYTTMMGMEGY